MSAGRRIPPTERDASRGNAVRDRPVAGSNFSVHIQANRGTSVDIGFCEVVLPDVWVQAPRRARTPHGSSSDVASAPWAGTGHLVLRRGVDGSAELSRWFEETRGARRATAAARRTVTIRLLAEDHATVVTTWRFSGVRPVKIGWTPLRAQAADVVLETLELAFDRVDVE